MPKYSLESLAVRLFLLGKLADFSAKLSEGEALFQRGFFYPKATSERPLSFSKHKEIRTVSPSMEWLIAISGLIAGILGMELFSWWFHKYLMHGILWKIHKTHHQPHQGWFEFNDVFTLLFGGMAVGFIFWGLPEFTFPFWVGTGITAYGIVYFVLHDMMIHKRINLFSRPTNRFLEGIFKAHQAHHRTNTKHDAESFGLLIVHRKFFRNKNR